MHNVRPPRWAERWIESRLPPEIAEALLGDLHLLYLDRRESAGRTRADLWYWDRPSRFEDAPYADPAAAWRGFSPHTSEPAAGEPSNLR